MIFYQTWQWLPPTRQRLADNLSAIPQLEVFDSSANFLLVKASISAVDLQLKLLLNDRILIRDCVSFPELGESYFRVAVKTDANNQRLVSGIDRLLTPE